jgi:hypothetical protein
MTHFPSKIKRQVVPASETCNTCAKHLILLHRAFIPCLNTFSKNNPQLISADLTMSQSKPRRTRSLGGCKTCKRRHVKCDQSRPNCQTCSGFGLSCEGFSDEVQWVPAKKRQGPKRPSNQKRGYLTSLGIRRHLYTGMLYSKARVCL